MKTPNLNDWHLRFIQQAAWTKTSRQYLYDKIDLTQLNSILDVGCGTGALLSDFAAYPQIKTFGIDLDYSRISYAFHHTGFSRVSCADAYHIPFLTETFDLVFCHYLLLWLKNPVNALREMNRVLKPGGHLLCLAEPDYNSRIEYPQEFSELANLQLQSLIDQGITPDAGRRLGDWCHQAGLTVEQIGVSGGQWIPSAYPLNENETIALQADLGEQLRTEKRLQLNELERQSRSNGSRVQYLPVFYTMAIKVSE